MLVKNGRVVTESGVVDADVKIDGTTIAAIAPDLSGDVLVDATDCWVLPGGVDPHVHISLEGHSTMEPLLDDLETATRAALMGGVTTIGAYVQHVPDKTIVEMMRSLIDYGRDHAHVDFLINALMLPGDDIDATVAAGGELGVTSYKALVAYSRRGVMLGDEDLLRLMTAVARLDGLTLIHAENGGGIDFLESVERERGVDKRQPVAKPAGVFEAEGMFRTATFAEVAGSRLLFVHLTSKEGAEMLRYLKGRPYGDRIFVETQPHYLSLTNQEVLERGPLGKVGPPLKHDEDIAALWSVIQDGLVNHLSSDHSTKSKSVKLSTSNILDAGYGGIAGVEVVPALAYCLGYETGRIGIETVAALSATNAAKVYGVYPKKGAIRVGSDADLSIVPREQPAKRLVPENLHGKADYSIYESLSSTGFPRDVVRLGALAVRDGRPTGDNPRGSYLARSGG
jgi:dihydropyrimidinase